MDKSKYNLSEFDAQQWLFREFLEKLKMNNVKRVVVCTEDKEGSLRTFEYRTDNKKQVKRFIRLLSKEPKL